MRIACIIIASRNRGKLLDELVLPSVVAHGFDEVVVVGDFHSGSGWRHLPFPPLTGTTVDAQLKRDVGTAATSSDVLLFLCDDHRLHPDFSQDLAVILTEQPLGPTDIIIPARFCVRESEKIGLNMGYPGYMGRMYVGGHAGIFPRTLLQQVPWSIAPFHPNWDFYHSRILVERGAVLRYQSDRLFIEDIEPGTEPWL